MADNVIETLQRLIQDVIAPDVRELKVRLSSLERSVDERFTSMEKSVSERFTSMEKSVSERFTSLERQSEAQFKALLAAIGEARAQSELASTRDIAALSERVAILEVRRQ